jgi:hypothetical protein
VFPGFHSEGRRRTGLFLGPEQRKRKGRHPPGTAALCVSHHPSLGGQSLYRDHKNRSGGLDKILIPLIFKDGETEKFPVAGSESAEAKMRPVSERLSRMANSSFPPPNETKS